MLLGERGERFHGTSIFHNSSILKTSNAQAAFTLLAVCYVGAKASTSGWCARAGRWITRKYSTDYLQAEAEAKRDGAGLWRGEVTPPWEWRAERH
jgi:hypothetical protein